eukprot:m.285503 g.285503  ORF g.285503 m.285503 type:complete len:641 (+) comp16341_c0_seq15:274-2196(+)
MEPNKESEFLFLNASIWHWENSDISSTKGRFVPKQWMKVKDYKIVEIGDMKNCSSCFGDGKDGISETLQTIDLGNSAVVPGLHDAHVHIEMLGAACDQLDLRKANSIANMQEILREFAATRPKQKWIQCIGLDHEKLTEGRLPNRQEIDAALLPGQHAFVFRTCWHVGIASTNALRVAGILADVDDAANFTVPTVSGGQIDMDENGVPSGVLREAAVALMVPHMTEIDPKIRRANIMRGLTLAAQSGLTHVHTNDNQNSWPLYKSILSNEKDGLPVRVSLTPDAQEIVNVSGAKSEVEKVEYAGPGESVGKGSGMLRCDRLKIFGDGSLGAETAALRNPYVNTTKEKDEKGEENLGILIHEQETINALVKGAKDKGYRLEVHAIGDRAAESVLQAFETAGLTKEDRGIITHCQVLGPDLIKKMATMGVIANVQPSFVRTDAEWVKRRIQPNIQKWSYCWKTLMKENVMVSFGSDAPVETCSPLRGMYDAMNRNNKIESNTENTSKRRKLSNDKEEIFLEHECLIFEEALYGYTRGAAYAAGVEHAQGSLEAGFEADFVVLNKNVITKPSSCIEKGMLEQVWVAGSCRYNVRDTKPMDGGLNISAEAWKRLAPVDFTPGRNGPRHCLFCGGGRKSGMSHLA